jgi:hypothetical protein
MDTWSARSDDREAVMNEENISFLKLKFPLVEGEEWNGNLYNSIGEDTYLMEATDAPFTSNGTEYLDCLVINQHDNQDFVVALDRREEVYAKNIGLVYRLADQISFCTVGTCLGKQQIESGVKYMQTIKAYGRE